MNMQQEECWNCYLSRFLLDYKRVHKGIFQIYQSHPSVTALKPCIKAICTIFSFHHPKCLCMFLWPSVIFLWCQHDAMPLCKSQHCALFCHFSFLDIVLFCFRRFLRQITACRTLLSWTKFTKLLLVNQNMKRNNKIQSISFYIREVKNFPDFAF